jgi:hypothetical protein
MCSSSVYKARYNVPCITGRTVQQDTKEAACSQFCSRVNLLNKDYLQLQHTDRRDVVHVFMSHQHQASGLDSFSTPQVLYTTFLHRKPRYLYP